jgi:DNA-binding XRE family transcriptional regulator
MFLTCTVHLMHHFCMKIDEWMVCRGLTDARLGEMLQVDRVTVSRIRRGQNKPSWELAARIKEVSGGAVTADDFLPKGAA